MNEYIFNTKLEFFKQYLLAIVVIIIAVIKASTVSIALSINVGLSFT